MTDKQRANLSNFTNSLLLPGEYSHEDVLYTGADHVHIWKLCEHLAQYAPLGTHRNCIWLSLSLGGHYVCDVPNCIAVRYPDHWGAVAAEILYIRSLAFQVPQAAD
jgi:hypothetical protein